MSLHAAVDEVGNESPRLVRRVFIDASCPDGEEWCPETVACEQPLLCLPQLTAVYMPVKEVYVPPVDETAPTLELRMLPGDIVLSPVTPGPHIVETTITLGEGGYTDPRWHANDDTDGDISDRASSLGLSAVATASLSSTPTEIDAPLMITYSVHDESGNDASAVRLVHLVCSDGEESCTAADGSLACTVGGVCSLVVEEEAEIVPATVELLGPEVVFIPVGQRYLTCSPDLPLELLCDQVGFIYVASGVP